MNLTTALKLGVIPDTINPIDIILTAHKEGLNDLLQKQIPRHHQIIRKARDAAEARSKFRVACDFSDSELAGMNDLKAWSEEDTNGATIVDMMSSVYIDESARGAQSLTMMQSSLSILKSLRRKKIHRPVDDSTVTQCYNCSSAFGMLNRKHHCRACGRIFCYACSQWSERIPPDLVSYTDTKKWVFSGQVMRVCQSCRDMIVNFRRIEHLVEYFEIVAFPFDLCVRASTLSRDWREAMRIYLSNVRDMQYSLPSSVLTERDRRALQSNLSHLQGHSKWLLQALKMGLIEVDGPRIKSCHDMMCDRNCTPGLTALDAVIILNTAVYNVEVRLLALRILEQSVFPPDIALFLPMEDTSIQEFILRRSDLFLDFFWLSRINQGLGTDIFRNKLLLANQDQAMTVQESIRLISMLEGHNDVYDLSQQLQSLKVPFMGPFGMIDKFESEITEKHSATRPIIVRYLSDGMRRAFLYKKEDIRKDAHVVSLIRLMYHLCGDIFMTCEDSGFLPIHSEPMEIDSNYRDSGSWFTRDSPISSPGSVKYPSSLPIIIKPSPLTAIKMPPPPPPSPLTDTSSTASSVPSLRAHSVPNSIYPGSDLMSRSLPANLTFDPMEEGQLSLLDAFPRTDAKFLVTYHVVPISTNSGFIEIVPNALTLSDILARGSISNYLYRSNSNRKVSEVSSNYSASLAFWTVVTYLLGVGDRHLENIMIRNDGILFHIDYGFVFGADTTATFVRLDHDLIEGLGGSEMYEPFKERCCEIYCCLRRHFNVICACLLRLATVRPPIKGYAFTPEFIEKFVTTRFLLGQTEEEAKEAFSNIIDSSRGALVRRVSDIVHSTMSTLKLRWWSQ